MLFFYILHPLRAYGPTRTHARTHTTTSHSFRLKNFTFTQKWTVGYELNVTVTGKKQSAQWTVPITELPLTASRSGSSICIVTGYGLDGSGDRIPVTARFSAPVQIDPGAHPASCTVGTGSFPGVKSGRGVTLTPHPLLVPLVMKD